MYAEWLADVLYIVYPTTLIMDLSICCCAHWWLGEYIHVVCKQHTDTC